MIRIHQLLAALITADEVGIPKANGGSDAGLLNAVLNPIYFWAGVIAVIVIIAGGFMYVTSSGDAQHVIRAKNAIFAALIGLALVLSAFVITNYVIKAFS